MKQKDKRNKVINIDNNCFQPFGKKKNFISIFGRLFSIRDIKIYICIIDDAQFSNYILC